MRYEATNLPADSGRKGRMTLLLSILLVLLSCAGDGSAPSIDISLKRTEDDVEVHLTETAATFLVTSITGIGEMHITSYANQWPDTIRIQLRYDDGSGFHRLESFTVKTDSLLARTFFGRLGDVPLYCIGAQTRIDSSAICGGTVISLKQKEGCIEAIIPQIFTSKGTTRFAVSWIDMYRR
jgi:hypothetical protein